MPVIKAQRIAAFSSEDASHPAQNLLSSDTYRKWKCASAGEKQAVVVFQLQAPVQICSIDIGNEGSAFVEILVARSSSDNEDYKVLLVASSFMTPPDSKAWKNTNRVRMFGPDKLSKGVAEEKWDRVRVVCTQPYNKKEQYGLSFIALHSPPGESSAHGGEATPTTTPTPTTLGAFSLKEEPKVLPTGSLFYKKESTLLSSPGGNAAAQARSATAAALRSPQQFTSPQQGRRREGKERRGEEGKGKVRKGKERGGEEGKGKERRGEEGGREEGKGKQRRGGEGGEEEGKGKERRGEEERRKARGKTKMTEDVKKEEEGSSCKAIMSGVVFTLSGFQNPYRSELREKMVEMGASYQPNWTDSCTHLICAFPNTPKYTEVRAKSGLIVRKEWVLDSFIKKKRLPAGKYRLSGGVGDSGSEDESYDERERSLFGSTPADKSSRAEGTAGVKRSRDQADMVQEREDEYGGSTDEAEDAGADIVKRKPLPLSSSSECDTEDEIQRVRAGQEEYEATTETDSGDDEEVRKLSFLPNLFSESHFMLYGNFSPGDRRLLRRYITAYNGLLEDYMSEKVAYVVTLEGWDAKFDQALEDNSSLTFVRPKWIFECHEKQCCVPHQPFTVAPS